MDHIALIAWQVVGCFLLADFITGFIHWLEDSYLTLKTPLIANQVVLPNIMHHKHPRWMVTMGSFLSRNIQTVIASSIVVAAIYIVCYLRSAEMPWYVWTIAIFTCVGNECHGWAHGSSDSRIVKFLQDTAIVTTPIHHGLHHRAPYDKRFCTLTNVMNPILDGLRFWRALEWMIGLVGIKPKRMTAARDYV